MLLREPFLYDFVADHQRALREAAERGRAGTHRPNWRRWVGTAAAVARDLVRSLASPWRGCGGRRLECRHAAVGNDV